MQCLSSGTADWIHAHLDTVRLESDDFYCDVQRFNDGWELVEFLATPYRATNFGSSWRTSVSGRRR